MFVLDYLLMALFIGTWLACIWTTGNDPLSIRFGYTSLVFFVLLLPAVAGTLVAIMAADEESEKAARAAVSRGEISR
jgi:hypothetical protein